MARHHHDDTWSKIPPSPRTAITPSPMRMRANTQSDHALCASGRGRFLGLRLRESTGVQDNLCQLNRLISHEVDPQESGLPMDRANGVGRSRPGYGV